jgi:protease I
MKAASQSSLGRPEARAGEHGWVTQAHASKGDHMVQQLNGKKIAFIAADGVEQVELERPWQAAREAGAEVELLSVKSGQIQGVHGMEMGDKFTVDHTLADVTAEEYDALVIPGGVKNPDILRMHDEVVQFVRNFFEQQKPVAAICHGPWVLVEADVLRGRTITSWPSLKTDIRNAGGTWVDEEVHVDAGLVTSRKPDDLDAFCSKLLEEVAEGLHERQAISV